MMRNRRCSGLLLALFCATSVCWGESLSDRIDPNGIQGSLLIAGGGQLPESVWERFIQLAGGSNGHLVLIPTAAHDDALKDQNAYITEWKKYSLASVSLLHTRSRDAANDPSFSAPLERATAVWFGGGDQSRIADAYVGTEVEKRLLALLNRGGIIGGSSAGAAVQSRVMITGGNPVPTIGVGFDFLPDSIIDQHFRQRERKPRLLEAVAKHPSTFGLGIDEETAVLVRGRTIEVLGENKVTVCFAKSSSRPAKDFELKPGLPVDLTELRRAARQRALGLWPAAKPEHPAVPKGALVLGGGGRMPLEGLKRFIELAGGPESRIVILPTADESTTSLGEGPRRMLEKAGAKNLAILPAKTLAEVEREDNLSELANARGLWFGGGRQWRFVDAYEGTKAIASFHDILRRGGVIGGSSAGASIQADYLVRGSPRGNLEMMAEGYERGFGFLPGTAVDQHFSQRNRRRDLESFLDAFPQFLGVGIDEDTVLIVQGCVGEVVGKHRVWFFDQSVAGATSGGEPRTVTSLDPGMRFDLMRRQRLSTSGVDGR